MPTLETLPAEIQVLIVRHCDLKTKKAWRQTCKAFYFAVGVLPLGQVYLAARDKTLSAVKNICDEEHYRRMATGLVIDILMYDPHILQDNTKLHAMYVAKQELRNPGQTKWSLSLAKMEFKKLCDNQRRCIVEHQGSRFRNVLVNALRQLENVETISITDHFSRWYYNEGPLSWDVKYAPFPAYSTAFNLGVLTMILVAGLWQTRETRHPKTKSFVAEIVGDPNGQSEIAGLPYDTMFWGVRSLMKNDDSVFRGVFNGFEHLSIDISHRQHYTGFGENVRRLANTVKPWQKREEWLGIGKMLAGAENLLSLNLRFRDGTLDQGHFEALLGHPRWINLTSLRLFNVHASAENLARVLEDHTNLKTLALIRVAISGDLQTTGVVGQVANPIADLEVWDDLARRVASVLTLESVALFCLLEQEENIGESEWLCGRMPVCRYTDVEEAMLSGRTNGWSGQGEYELPQNMVICNEHDLA